MCVCGVCVCVCVCVCVWGGGGGGGGGSVINIYFNVYIYISNTIFFKYNIENLKPPVQYCNIKFVLENNFKGGHVPGTPPLNPALPPVRWWVFSIYNCLLHTVILIYCPVHLILLITSLVCTYGEIYELLLRSTGRLHGVCRRSTSGSWVRDVITALLHHRALSAVGTFHEKKY